MKSPPPPPPRTTTPDSAALRRASGARVKKQPATNPPAPVADLQHTQHELEVHQVELEMQNKSLVASQAELQAALEHFADFYESAPVGYLSLKPDGEIRQLNPFAAALLGRERYLLINRRLGLLVDLSDRAAFSDFLGRVFEGQTQACEVTLEQPAAAPLPIRDNPCNPCRIVRFEAVPTPSGQECWVVMTNITERRLADEALRAEADRRLILFQQLPDGIVVIDPQTARFVEFNTAAHQQLGYSQAEFAQLTVREVEVKDADAETLARFTEANQTGSVDFETLHRTRQGEIRNIHVTARLVIVRGRAVHQCVFRDITERKRAEAALSQKTIELGERVKELQCLYEMSKLVAASDKYMGAIFKEAVCLIPPGWQYPEIACARIAIGEEQFMTDNFRQTPWRLSADLVASGEKLGSVEVCYLEERPTLDEGPFLKEERALIDSLARKISATVERERATMVLQQTNQSLAAANARANALAEQAT